MSDKLYKIAILTPYFGHINGFFKLWLRSAFLNKTIDFLIPTDCGGEIQSTGFVGENIHIIPMSLAEFKAKADSAIGMDCNIDHARKICDYRCALGLIFKDELKDFDFWGYTDNDQIMGDMRKFLSQELLSKYNKIGAWGHFSLFKNVDYMNTLFMTEPKNKSLMFYKDVYSTPYNCFFEERTMVEFCKEKGIEFFEDEELFIDTSPSYYRFINRKWENPYTPYYVLEDGVKVFVVSAQKDSKNRVKKELMYAHFQKRKFTISVDDLHSTNCLVYYPNVVEDGANMDEERIVKKARKSNLVYGWKKRILHSYSVRYNNYQKKHSKKFKQKYY